MLMHANASLADMHTNLVRNAYESFAFLANNILASHLSEDMCKDVQDALRDGEAFYIETRQPRALAIALHAWLKVHGVTCVCNIAIPHSELLVWLDIPCDESDVSAVIDVQKNSVRLTWLVLGACVAAS